MKTIVTILVVCLVVVGGLSICIARGMFSSESKDLQSKILTQKNEETEKSAKSDETGLGILAIKEAAQAKQYLFAFFWKNKDDQTAAMNEVFDGAMKKVSSRSRSVNICITDPTEKNIVEKFELARAPMPLILAFAPNGAIMGGFPNKVTEEDLLGAFGSPCSERCMKALQDGKLVFLCIQNSSTKSNDEALSGVNKFKTDDRFAKHTEVIILDPSDAAESALLADLKIDSKESEAITAFMAPPGSVIAEFKGATNMDDLISALQKASTGCGPGGCGPGGCGPKQ